MELSQKRIQLIHHRNCAHTSRASTYIINDFLKRQKRSTLYSNLNFLINLWIILTKKFSFKIIKYTFLGVAIFRTVILISHSPFVDFSTMY